MDFNTLYRAAPVELACQNYLVPLPKRLFSSVCTMLYRVQALESREPTAVAVALELMLLALKVDPTVCDGG